MVSGRDELQCRGAGPDPVQGEQAGGAGGNQGEDELVEALELAVEEHGAPSQLAQRDAGAVACGVAGRGRSDAIAATRAAAVCLANRGQQVIGSGQDQGSCLVDRPRTFACGDALAGGRQPALRAAIAGFLALATP